MPARVDGRSKMNKDQLQHAVDARSPRAHRARLIETKHLLRTHADLCGSPGFVPNASTLGGPSAA